MINFKTAKTQRNFEPVPDGLYPLHLTIKPGGTEPDGWGKESKDGQSIGLDMEFTVVEGEGAGRKIFSRLTISGTTSKHEEAAEISKGTLRAILESARGVRPDDMSDAAIQACSVDSYDDMNDLRFLGKVGIQAAQNGYDAKNVLRYVVIPGMKDWHSIEQVKAAAASSGNSYAQASAARTHEPPAPPAAVSKPSWA